MLLASLFAAACAAALPTEPVVAGDGPLDDAALKALAARCGSQIEWMRDGEAPRETTGAYQARPVQKGDGQPPPPDRRKLLDDALARAKQENKLVLWHAYRIQGQQMYRAPVLDEYMDGVLWSDPTLVEMVRRHFVPLRTQVPRDLGKDFGLVSWDVVEPALFFLTPDGKVAHKIDRIRTFDPRWFAEVFRRVLKEHPDLPGEAGKPAKESELIASSRARYYDALGAYYGGDETRALEEWRELTATSPDSPFAWRAASNLASAADKTWPGAARHGYEVWLPVNLPPEGTIPGDTRWRRSRAEAESVAQAGVKWLLGMQRKDGGWNDCRYAYWPDARITPNSWMAITALAAGALNAWRDLAPHEIDGAITRAEDYLFGGGGHVNQGANEETYANSYRILYLDRILDDTEDAGQKQQLVERMRPLAERLAQLQVQGGQWAHEYPNAFASAVVLDALKRAQRRGIDVPGPLVERGVKGLLAARYDDGSFDYGGTHDAKAQSTPDHAKDSAGRTPLCEGALFDCEASDAQKLGHALSIYVQHYDRMEKVRQCDFHTDGELAGFFFFHDLFHATEQVRKLPPVAQKTLRAWFVERLCSMPEIDGSFLDDHEMGKSCSTALALLALKNVLAESAPR